MSMLWIKNLHKHYKSKNGEAHHALKGINLSLDQKGFICLLGKSGSGKSTLLNILGGLDTYDQGDIMIKSRHTEQFKSHEWDSFRNTYVGFIFQEFYMVDSFTIGKNIAISLELQGYPKKEIKDRVNTILKQVGLEGYANRKTSEISGGQKQRIAIARALIKNPQIILADEPTGNLDSETGKAILDILKELSKEKLVIMVTHDAESARAYGDRIIELKDGIIINDGLIHEENENYIYENKEENSSLIHFPKGKHLNQQLIQYLSQQTDRDEDRYIVLTTEPNLVNSSKFNLMSIDQLNKDENDSIKQSLVGPLTLKESYLPTRNAIKLALNNIKMKKFRFLFINFLFIISLVLLGFATIFSFFDFNAVTAETIKMNEIEYMGFKLEPDLIKIDDNVKFELPKSMSQAEIDELKEVYPDITFTKSTATKTSFTHLSRPEMPYFTNQMNHATIINDKEMVPLYRGRYPKEIGEVLISDYIARLMRVFAYGKINMSDLLGRTIDSGSQRYTIVGIVDTDYEKYNHLVNSRIPERFEEDNFFETANIHYKHLYMTQDTYNFSFNRIVTQAHKDEANLLLKLIPINEKHTLTLLGQSRLPVENNEIVIPASEAYSLFLSRKISMYNANDPDLLALIGNNFDITIRVLDQSRNTPVMNQDNGGYLDLTQRNYKIAGIYEDIEGTKVTSNKGWFGTNEEINHITELMAPYRSQYVSTYNWTYVKLSEDPNINEQYIIDMMEQGYVHVTEYSAILYKMNELINDFETVFYIVGAIVAIFTGLLIYLFISASISKKQKEIGILRAIGARGIDVSKIYMFEGIIISIISSLWANGIIIGLVYFANYYFEMEMNAEIVLLTFGVLNIVIVCGFALIVSILSSFLPIKRITVMKPIHAIKRI